MSPEVVQYIREKIVREQCRKGEEYVVVDEKGLKGDYRRLFFFSEIRGNKDIVIRKCVNIDTYN